MVSNNSLSNSDINTQTQKKQQNRCFILVSFHLVSQGTNKKSGLVFWEPSARSCSLVPFVRAERQISERHWKQPENGMYFTDYDKT